MNLEFIFKSRINILIIAEIPVSTLFQNSIVCHAMVPFKQSTVQCSASERLSYCLGCYQKQDWLGLNISGKEPSKNNNPRGCFSLKETR